MFFAVLGIKIIFSCFEMFYKVSQLTEASRMLKKIVEIGWIERENETLRKRPFSDSRLRVTVEVASFSLWGLAHRDQRKKLL